MRPRPRYLIAVSDGHAEDDGVERRVLRQRHRVARLIKLRGVIVNVLHGDQHGSVGRLQAVVGLGRLRGEGRSQSQACELIPPEKVAKVLLPLKLFKHLEADCDAAAGHLLPVDGRHHGNHSAAGVDVKVPPILFGRN